MAFGDVIRFRREQLGLDQTSLALRVGVTQQTISRWERSPRLPLARHFVALADALELPPAELLAMLGYTGDGESPATVTEVIARLADVDTPSLLQLVAEAVAEVQNRTRSPDG